VFLLRVVHAITHHCIPLLLYYTSFYSVSPSCCTALLHIILLRVVRVCVCMQACTYMHTHTQTHTHTTHPPHHTNIHTPTHGKFLIKLSPSFSLSLSLSLSLSPSGARPGRTCKSLEAGDVTVFFFKKILSFALKQVNNGSSLSFLSRSRSSLC
jgi:hypothetical protein